VLLVCTGNLCRSPLAERLGTAYVQEALGGHAGAVRLASAGIAAVVGSGMHPHSALVLQGLGGDPTGFRARQLTGAVAASADLVLVMTRTHRRAVLEAAPRGLSRTFTLREAADLVSGLGARADVPGDDFLERARTLVQLMAAARSRRRAREDDEVPDPVGLPLEVHEEVGEAVAEALLTVLEAVVLLHRGDGAATTPQRLPPDLPVTPGAGTAEDLGGTLHLVRGGERRDGRTPTVRSPAATLRIAQEKVDPAGP
jgi:protein-tyrosine phosphatase